MTPRTVARPAAAGALCFAFSCTAAPVQAALKPQIDVHHRKLDLRSGKRAVVVGNVAPGGAGLRVALEVRRGRRSVRVPVIDRGPYAGGREYDLTAATAQRLRFRGHGAILTTR
jgi:hypothetical protein